MILEQVNFVLFLSTALDTSTLIIIINIDLNEFDLVKECRMIPEVIYY